MLQFNEPVAFILELVHLALMGQQVVVLEVLIGIKSDNSVVIYMSKHRTNKSVWIIIEQAVSPDLILPADVRWVHHAVTPVLSFDLILFFSQEGQFLVAAMHVFIQAVQVMATPLGVVLRRKEIKLNKT